ncbi:Reticulocyte-binding protein 2-like protein a [Diplodia seriata]|uniref:Reticulocyte-binding protein 2-like protein a n=1 Tax=Diplodia seriata TaxID=420778 RepID=A0A1S8B5D0_9PEZI|nr:Reticulocyte-binding protein 2-like protein a [Diplodia seriata]
MSSIHDRFEVTTHPAVITPFEDVDDPLIDADIPHNDYYMFGPPSQSSDGRNTINSRSSAGRGRRLSNRTQLTEPSSISDMPSDCFPLAQHKKAMPRTSSPQISPTKSASPHRDITAYRSSVVPDENKVKTHHRSHHRPSAPRRSHHTSIVDTPTRFHPDPMPQYSSSSPSHHHLTPSHHSRSQSRAPLILLHVTLLPSPSFPYPPHVMQRVLPRSTMRAFALLEERLADPVLMTRGLLVAHPRDEMDVLEERVLEGLELRPPRVLKCGHFYGAPSPSSTANDDDDDDEEEAAANEEEEEEAAAAAAHDKSTHRRDSGVEATMDEEDAAADEITCTTCHAHLPLPANAVVSETTNTSRWSIKTYAANGLLAGPGAWAAAWSEMERIDVAVAPHLTAAQHRALARAVREEEEEREEREEREREEEREKDERARAAAAAAAAEEAKRQEEEEREREREEAEAQAERRREAEAEAAQRAEREAAMEAERVTQRREHEAAMLEAEREALVQAAREEERARAAEAAQLAETQRLRLIGNAALAAAAERRAAEERVERERKEAVRAERRRARDERVRSAQAAEKARRELPLGVLLARAAWVVAADWRNVLIALLAVVVAWGWVVDGGAGGGVGLDASLVAFDFDPVDHRVFGVDNATAPPPPLETAVVQTSTVVATATATHTSTAIVTAFVLETLSPATTSTTTVLAEQPSVLPSSSSSSSSSPDVVDADAAFKDAVFAASSDVLASAFEKMQDIVSTLTVAYEEEKEEEEEEGEEEAVSSVAVVVAADDDDDAALFQKDAAFAASSDVLASAFEKMQDIISKLTAAYEGEGRDGDGEAVLPVAGLVDVVVPEAAMVEDVCERLGLAYPACAAGEEALDVAATAVPGTSVLLGFKYFDPAPVCLAV